MLRQSALPQPIGTKNLENSPFVGPEESSESGHGTVARSALYLLLGQVMTTALGICFSAALGRTLGAGDFGIYFLISSFSAFAYVLVDWGQQIYVIREVASQPERSSTLLGTALVMRVAGAALVALPAGFAAWALGYNAITCLYCVVFIVVWLPIFLAQGYGMVFRARYRMGLDAWVSVVNKVALLALALAALSLGSGLPGVLVAQAVSGLLAFALANFLYRRLRAGPLHYSSDTAREILKGGSAILTASLATSIQPYIDAVILSKLSPADAIGWYGAAYSIMGTLVAPAMILGTASFPRLVRAAHDGQFSAQVQAALRPILWLGALASTGTFIFADDAIAIVYGNKHFGPAAMILKVLAPGYLLVFTGILLGGALTAIGRAKAFSVVKVASVVAATLLELVLVPHFQQQTGNGGIGLVTAFVASEFLVVGGTIFLLHRAGIGLGISVDMARAIGSAVLTLALFQWIPRLPFLVGVPLCVVTFLLCSSCLGLARRSDVQLFRSLLRKEEGGQ
jgi:O-antigen/teichoic acid export membrane protein